ncbi:hypothetical protein CC78DRAFT_545475 [Lojkania enalia]|uniref:Glycosyltransferase family 25 protein n=1 Tax=Lojkania enalia TaxID=147567 RepID=A0A9P4N7S8_9PLEO|nr:hypothetical protein CC78DRAFT_545475 [Didymosphaeria enalia]
MLVSRRRGLLPMIVVVVFILVLIQNITKEDRRFHLECTLGILKTPDKFPANSTLGFGAIVVVSKEESERRHSLLQAANVTDIDLTIPQQPIWTNRDVESFRNNEVDKVQIGSILAWMGHRNALQWFLDSGLETALILEDDVDWDIRLRSVQIPLAAGAARSLLPPAIGFSPWANGNKSSIHYWGDPASWDVLYLGHCGDYFDEVSDHGIKNQGFTLDSLPHTVYYDPTIPRKPELHPFTRQLFEKLKLLDHTRAFHRSKFPLCSFGYAITRIAAERLLSDFAPEKLTPKGPRAFDVALLDACKKGFKTPSPTIAGNPNPHPDPKLRDKYTSPGLRCWTLNSELFHHMPGDSQIGQISKIVGEQFGVPPVDLAGQQQILSRHQTPNIECGFWSGAFSFPDNDVERLKYLQEQVGRKGKCLK